MCYQIINDRLSHCYYNVTSQGKHLQAICNLQTVQIQTPYLHWIGIKDFGLPIPYEQKRKRLSVTHWQLPQVREELLLIKQMVCAIPFVQKCYLLGQSGYLFTKKDEFAFRYGRTSPDKKIDNYISLVNEYMLGYSHYFFRHNLKL